MIRITVYTEDLSSQGRLVTSIGIQTPGVHHVALRVSDLDRAKRFYTGALGFDTALEGPNIFLFMAGNTAIGVRGPESRTPAGDSFDHLAIGCQSDEELERVAAKTTEAGVENTGVKTDETLGKRYVAFKDPDRIS